jgi:uncharacterized protein (TIGR02246 family)
MTTSDDEHAIRELVDDWMAASKARDTEKVLTLMADDVLFTVPGQEPFGKEAFRAMSAATQGMQMDGAADIRELEIRGDWAWLRNYIEVTVTPPGGEPLRRSGYTLSILRKEPDGRWVLFRDANLG